MFSREMMPRWRLSKPFFYLLLFLIPFQTRKIFFTGKSFYFDYHAFYNTWYLYLTDLIVLGVITAWVLENAFFSRENSQADQTFLRGVIEKVSKDHIYLFMLAFWLTLATSLMFSRENGLGLYGLIKVTEFMLVFSYIREKIDFSREKFVIFLLILGSSCFQAGLGIWQYLNQYSAGFSLIGEEFLRPGLPGIAEFSSHGIVRSSIAQILPYLSTISADFSLNMRAYGTFPHPNVLAGFLFLGILANLYLLYFTPRPSILPHWWGRKGGGAHVKTLVLSLSLILLTTGQVVTFSRLAWAVTGLAIFVFFVLVLWRVRSRNFFHLKTGRQFLAGTYRPIALGLTAATLLLSLGMNWYLFGQQIKDRLGYSEDFVKYSSDESFVDRAKFNNVAVAMVKDKPLFGVGLRNFVVAMDDYAGERLLPYLHQPVHDIYLLIAAEAGVLALLTFVVFLLNIVRPAFAKASAGRHAIGEDLILRYVLVLTFLGFLAIGFFDHYLWTIQQGELMFWVVLGLMNARKEA